MEREGGRRGGRRQRVGEKKEGEKELKEDDEVAEERGKGFCFVYAIFIWLN